MAHHNQFRVVVHKLFHLLQNFEQNLLHTSPLSQQKNRIHLVEISQTTIFSSLSFSWDNSKFSFLSSLIVSSWSSVNICNDWSSSRNSSFFSNVLLCIAVKNFIFSRAACASDSKDKTKSLIFYQTQKRTVKEVVA